MITTMLINGGDLGEIEITISFKYYPPRLGRGHEPDQSSSAGIYWVKVGGYNGVEVFPPEDFVTDEIVPHCVRFYEDVEQ